MKCAYIFVLIILLSVPFSLADEDFLPYVHKASVPENPKVRLFGQYTTNLFAGAATYSYAIEAPKGVNGLEPSIVVSYNSQQVKQRPGILGAGWSINQDLIYRDVNNTPDNFSDDKFLMVLDGNLYELVYYEGTYHTEVDYWFRIENFSDYWLVTKQNGVQYRFGYNNDSKLASNRGWDYSLKWFLDQVEDTHDNVIDYSYYQNPYAEDSGAVYLSKIEYNADKKRVINFNYESYVRSDRRRIYEQGNLLEESRRLSDIYVVVNDSLVRRYHFNFVNLSNSLSGISSLTYIGSDNSSSLFNISFTYYSPVPGFYNQSNTSKPPVLFSGTSFTDLGVRLVDLNNDGFVDVVQASSTGDHSWVNNKLGNWTLDNGWNLPVYVTNSGIDLGVRFEDINGDGYPDLLKSNSSVHAVYINNGHGWNSSSWSIPCNFVSGGSDQGVQLADVNGDGRADIVRAKTGSNRSVYINNGTGWTNSSWVFPTDLVNAASRDLGVRMVDLNGDGLVDIVRSYYSGNVLKSWLNNGSGWIESSNWTPPSDFYFVDNNKPDTGARFADINGDGLVDIIQYYVNSTTGIARGSWLNTGSGWLQDNDWNASEPFVLDGHNIGYRLADVNGDGFADILISQSNSSNAYTAFKNSSYPFLLESITNEYGGVTSINYSASTTFNNSEDGYSGIGFNIFVVSDVIKNNSLADDFNAVASSSYDYAKGKYDYDKSEFRGFGFTREINPSSVVKHYFYQDDPRRGKEYQTEIYDDSGNLFSVSIKDYNYTYGGGIYNLSLRSDTKYSYDGSDEPVVSNKSFEYNIFGNPRFVIDYGDVDVLGDEKYYNYSYGFNFDDWIIDKISRITIYDADMNKVKEIKYYYDGLGLNGVGSKGDLTKTEQWLENGNNSYSWLGYDDFGNLIEKSDSLDNLYKYNYDDLNIFIESIINPLGHVTTYDYNPGTGNLLYEEKNGVRTSYEYDAFGRIIKEIKPYDSSGSPTKSYEYYFDGVAPEKISVKLKTTDNKSENINYFYDGFANLAQVKSEVEDGNEIVKNIFYDDEFMVGSEQNPYFAGYSIGLTAKSATANLTEYTYDALGRVVFVLNPDGTNKTILFDRLNVSDYDENGHRHTYTLDAYGRINKVWEFVVDPFTNLSDVYVTTYDYDTNDNLVKITDNEGHVFRFTYDALGRKVAMNDPDMGNWTYLYDTNGNLIKQTDARVTDITLAYDALNRVISKVSSDVNITFSYDKDYYGTLSNLSVNNDTFFSFTYDDRLRVTNQAQNVNGVLFSDDFVYDSQDRVISDNGLNYIFALNGKVGAIPGYINWSDYNEFGSILLRNYSNTLVVNYSYNVENNRLLSIISPNVMSVNYSYDNVGNILSISDGITGRMQQMSYDYLDRLVRVTSGSDSYIYSFNSIGNIMKVSKNNQSKKYTYTGLAHAPSRISDGSVGVDLYNPHELDTDSRRRVFEFYLVNELGSGNFSPGFGVSFGEGSSFNSTVLFNVSDSTIVLVENNYSSGGDYVVNFSANSSDSSDYEVMGIKFGTESNDLSLNYSNVSVRRFNLVIVNDVSEAARNVVWNCSNGLSNLTPVNISGNSSLSLVLEYNYSNSGNKSLVCDVHSADGNDSICFGFTIPGLAVNDYDVLYTNGSRRVVLFEAGNSFNRMETQINVTTNSVTSSQKVNLSSNEGVIVITEDNYSIDGPQNYNILLSGNGSTTPYKEAFKFRGVDIYNYSRIVNGTLQVLSFTILNNWNTGLVNWSLTDPSVSNSSNMSTGSRVTVTISNNYTSQAWLKPNINAKVSNYTDIVRDLFENRPLGLNAFDALALGSTRGIFELVSTNNLNRQQNFSWCMNTGVANISSSNPANLTSGESIFVIVESNYSSTPGIFRTNASINSSNYNDSQTGVIVI